MKKIFLLLISILLVCGCSNEKDVQVDNKTNDKKEEVIIKDDKEDVVEDKYVDLNTTPIGIYKLKGNTLYKLKEDSINVKPFDDIGIFQIYPSIDDQVIVNEGFATSFYNKWIEYKQDKNLKIGFNIKFVTLTDEVISYNILGPDNTFDKWEYVMNYLYDDYANRGKGFYSHIESNQYNQDTLFTAIKMQSNDKIYDIKDKIELSVFTYDSEDDFLDGEYRGNSKYTYTINIIK